MSIACSVAPDSLLVARLHSGVGELPQVNTRPISLLLRQRRGQRTHDADPFASDSQEGAEAAAIALDGRVCGVGQTAGRFHFCRARRAPLSQPDWASSLGAACSLKNATEQAQRVGTTRQDVLCNP